MLGGTSGGLAAEQQAAWVTQPWTWGLVLFCLAFAGGRTVKASLQTDLEITQEVRRGATWAHACSLTLVWQLHDTLILRLFPSPRDGPSHYPFILQGIPATQSPPELPWRRQGELLPPRIIKVTFLVMKEKRGTTWSIWHSPTEIKGQSDNGTIWSH